MTLSGKIIAELPEVSGEGKNGRWVNKEFVLETFDQYPKKVCFQISGNMVSTTDTRVGLEVTVDFNPESREYNGRFYTTLKAWRVGRYISETEKYQQKQHNSTPDTPDVRYNHPTTMDFDNDLPY